jgi:hypothetical protein
MFLKKFKYWLVIFQRISSLLNNITITKPFWTVWLQEQIRKSSRELVPKSNRKWRNVIKKRRSVKSKLKGAKRVETREEKANKVLNKRLIALKQN